MAFENVIVDGHDKTCKNKPRMDYTNLGVAKISEVLSYLLIGQPELAF
jgi:hypothetical protein